MTRPTRRAPASGAAGSGQLEERSREQALKALSHPTRVAILAHLRAHETANPAELAQLLALPIGRVSYHVRRLEQLGLIDLVEQRQRRSVIQHFYALAPGAASNQLVREMTAGMLSRRREPLHANARALLDATAIGELRPELRHLFERLRALEADSVGRAGVKGHTRMFAVEVGCTMDAGHGATA